MNAPSEAGGITIHDGTFNHTPIAGHVGGDMFVGPKIGNVSGNYIDKQMADGKNR